MRDQFVVRTWRGLIPILIFLAVGIGMLLYSDNANAQREQRVMDEASFKRAVFFCQTYSKAGYTVQYNRLQGLTYDKWVAVLDKIPDGVKIQGGNKDEWMSVLDHVFDSYDNLLTAVIVRDTMFSICMHNAMDNIVPDRMNPIYPSAIKGEA